MTPMCSFCTLSLRVKLSHFGLGSCKLVAYGVKASVIGLQLIWIFLYRVVINARNSPHCRKRGPERTSNVGESLVESYSIDNQSIL